MLHLAPFGQLRQLAQVGAVPVAVVHLEKRRLFNDRQVACCGQRPRRFDATRERAAVDRGERLLLQEFHQRLRLSATSVIQMNARRASGQFVVGDVFIFAVAYQQDKSRVSHDRHFASYLRCAPKEC
jgi:hypothetical protein